MTENTVLDFVQQLLETNHIPVRHITLPSKEWNQLDFGLRSDILHIEDLHLQLNRWTQDFLPNHIYHSTDEFQCNYTAFFLPDSNDLVICGPVIFEKMTCQRLKEIIDKLNLSPELSKSLENYYLRVVFCPLQSYYESLFIVLANFLYGENNYTVSHIDSGELDEWYHKQAKTLLAPEKPFLSIQMIEERYDMEQAVLTAVSNGNETKAEDLFLRWISLPMPPRMVNELRDQKDYTITLNTLLRKTAEQSGVHPIHIDCYSNRNVQKIEQLTSLEQCRNFQKKIVRGYCRLIREHTLKNFSLLTQKVITYISTDLRADLSLKSLSERLSVNASYLSTLFKKEMGMPLTDYVNRQRIELSQRLLLSTDMPIKSVALQCGIPDVYYFSRLFKRIVGTTPKVYRETSTFQNFQALNKTRPSGTD